MSRDLNSARGIPKGNTVAVVGDPGTGKTTLLLTFWRYGQLDGGGLTIGPQHAKDGSPHQATRSDFDDLLTPRVEEEEGGDHPHLRCFVTLETSFARLRRNHPELIPQYRHNHTHYVFIDASAFLSGRLEDFLRYPQLAGRSEVSSSCSERVCERPLSLGGYSARSDQHFGLYWQDDRERPKRIEDIDRGQGLFQEPDKPKLHRLYDLMTPPIPHPDARVRLLKDLLAALFASENYRSIVLAVDSLSALMAPGEEREGEGTSGGSRRLGILSLVRWLEENEVTTFMSCEATRHEGFTLRGKPLFLGAIERYLASGIIQLDYHTYPSGDAVRYLRIMKMRGASHDMGPHAYGLDEKGLAWLERLFSEPGSQQR